MWKFEITVLIFLDVLGVERRSVFNVSLWVRLTFGVTTPMVVAFAATVAERSNTDA